MIPFHKIYAFLFKSFSIGEETKIVERLIEQWYNKMMIIKRSWVYILYIGWIPFLLLLLSFVSIFIAYSFIDEASLKWTIIIGNILMSSILLISSFVYWIFFRRVYRDTEKIIEDMEAFKSKLQEGDRHFIIFFNWSLTNQWILGIIMVLEIIFVAQHFNTISQDQHFLLAIFDVAIIFAELYFLQKYRKHMIDLEMDYNIVVQGKIFFINQSGVLSNTQTLESDKIKTIKSTFPSALASFFNFWNIEILTEGDTGNLGAMQMNYVTSPAKVVNSIQLLLGESRSTPPIARKPAKKEEIINETIINVNNPPPEIINEIKSEMVNLHAIDTRGKVRDILR